jgi:hypothetical protein
LASILAWLWAALMAAGVVSLGIPLVLQGRSLILPAVLLILAVGLGLSARGIGRQRHPYQWVAILMSAIAIVFHVVWHSPASDVGIPLNLVIIAIVALHWRRFTAADAGDAKARGRQAARS